MHNSNLFATLSTFSKDEFKRFGDLVSSPFFNSNKTLIALYNLIGRKFPDLFHKSLIKENAFRKLFPGEKYNDNRMRLLIHRLNTLSEQFLIQINLANSKSWSKVFLLDVLKARKLFKSHEKHAKEARKINYEENKNTNEFYFIQFTIENNFIASQVSRNLDANEKALVASQLLIANKSLNCMSIVSILKFSLFLENIRYRMKLEPRISLINEIITHLHENDYSEHPIVTIYFNMLMMLRDSDNISYYNNAKNCFFENEDQFHFFDRINVYINLENYLWKLYRRDHAKPTDEVLKLYQRRFEKDNYKMGGYMPHQIYKRVVRASLMKNDLKYAEKFMSEYKKELHPEFKKGVYSFSCALCCFHKKEYGKALEYLAIAQSEDLSHKIDVKNLILFIHYEQNDYELLRLSLDSYRHFLKNNQTISEQVRNRSANIIKFLNKLIKLRMNYDDYGIKKLYDLMNQCGDLENRKWFFDKVESLKERSF